MNHATLNVVNGPLRGKSLPLEKRNLIIGSGETCDLKLEGYGGIAEHHARLTWDGSQFHLQALNEAPRVFADGRSIPGETGLAGVTQSAGVIQPGECLEIGDFVARLWLPHAPPQFIDPAPAEASPAKPEPLERKERGFSPVLTWSCVFTVCFLAFVFTALRIGRSLDGTPVPDAGGANGAVPTAQPPRVVGTYNLGAEVAASVKAATVFISRPTEGGAIYGSGFIAGDGRRIVTNRHVVVDEKTGQIQPCTLIFYSGTPQQTHQDIEPSAVNLPPRSNAGEDFTDDLAIITLFSPMPGALPLGRSEDLQVASTVYAAGFPAEANLASRNNPIPEASIKAEAVERLQTGTVYGSTAVTVIQLSGTITHGNSGGPVVNAYGQVVGVVSRGDIGAGRAYAIPNVYLQSLL